MPMQYDQQRFTKTSVNKKYNNSPEQEFPGDDRPEGLFLFCDLHSSATHKQESRAITGRTA